MYSLHRRISVGAAALLVALSLTSCNASAYEDERREVLNEAVSELDLDSLSDVVCEYDGGRIGIGTGLQHAVVLSGTDSWLDVEQRLRSRKYELTATEVSMSGHRSDGEIYAVARLISSGPDFGALSAQFEEQGCVLPASGAISVSVEETRA